MASTAVDSGRPPTPGDTGSGAPPPGARHWTRLLVASALLTALAGGVSVSISRDYYRIAAFHHDSGAYRAEALRIDALRRKEGLARALYTTLRMKDGLDLTVRLLAAPASLRGLWGHLWVLLPLLGLFLFLTGTYAFQRTRSGALAMCVPLLLFSSCVVYDPAEGIADYWKDTVSAWALASAAAAWLLAGAEPAARARRPLMASGVLLGALAHLRPAAAVYAAALFAPLVLHAFVGCLRRDGARDAALKTLWFLAPALVLGGSAVLFNWRGLFHYYIVSGYAYGRPADVFWFLVGEVQRQMAVTAVATAGYMALLLLSRRRAAESGSFRDTLTAAWFVLGFPVVVVLTGGYFHGFLVYWTPLIILLVATLTPLRPDVGSARRLAIALAVVAAAAAIGQAVISVEKGRQQALSSTGTRALYDELAVALKGRRYGLLFYDPWVLILNHAAYHHGHTLSGSVAFSTIHDTVVRARFPGWTANRIARTNLRMLEAQPGTWAIAHCEPATIPLHLGPALETYGPLARSIAARSAAQLRDRPGWRVLRTTPSPFGCLRVYEFRPEHSLFRQPG